MSKKNSKYDFSASGFFVMRTPLLSVDDYLQWGNSLTASEAKSEDLSAAISQDRATLQQRLVARVADPQVKESLFLASPNFFEQLEEWIADPQSSDDGKMDKTCVRYFTRMTTRSTPFGLFGGCSFGEVSTATNLQLAPRDQYRKHTRLDNEYLCSLVAKLLADPKIRSGSLYFPNTSLYQIGDRFRYAETTYEGQSRTHQLVGVEVDDYLQGIMNQARRGAKIFELIEFLTQQGIEEAEAADFIEELINSQLLIAKLEPAITGKDGLTQLQQTLAENRDAERITSVLNEVQQMLKQLDESNIGESPTSYYQVAEALKRIPAKVKLPRLFQVDLFKPSEELTLGTEVVEEISSAIEILRRITSQEANPSLQQFQQEFIQRYADREVPLVEVLDEESGIGFQKRNAPNAEATPLLEGIAFPQQMKYSSEWTSRDEWLLKKLFQVQASNAQTLDLSEQDLAELETSSPATLPNAFAVMAAVAASSSEAVSNGDFQVRLQTVLGPSGARFLGRFCHLDQELEEKVGEHLRAEEQQNADAIFAEIVHLPEGRTGNILSRPCLREHEIPFLGQSGVPLENQIQVNDLTVSVKNGRIVLKSKRLQREIIPRLSTAHNYLQNGLGIYRFLCALQDQDVTSALGWSWGPLRNLRFLPRVTVGRVVLSRATWNLDQQDLARLSKQKDVKLFRHVQQLRNEWKLPRFIAVQDGDNELTIDLDNILSIETMVDLLKSRESATLVEVFPHPEQLCTHSEEGKFVHEIVIPFEKYHLAKNHVEKTQIDNMQVKLLDSEVINSENFPRMRNLGSDWLYLNLFTGTNTTDRILSEFVQPMIHELKVNHLIQCWFYLRYNDPSWHLRLRLQGDPATLMSKVLPLVTAYSNRLLELDLIHKSQFDTYEREVERYGGPHGMLASEEVFHIDSAAAIDLVSTYRGASDSLWQLALAGIDQLLSDLRLTLEEKSLVVSQARDAFAREFQFDSPLRHQLSHKYRKVRKTVEVLLAENTLDKLSNANLGQLQPGIQRLKQRSIEFKPIVDHLQQLESEGKLTVSLSALGMSYMHMFVNRLLPSAHRAQELVLYDFLARHYESLIARKRKSKSRS